MLEIFYLNKQHPLPPAIDLHTSVVVCCDQLPQMKVTRLLHLHIAAFPVLAAAQGVMGCLCQQIYLLKFRPLRCDTCSNSNRDVTTTWKRGVSYWMTPLIYWWKRMRCQNKSGNRLEYIKWCVSTELEPSHPVFLKLSCPKVRKEGYTHACVNVCGSGNYKMGEKLCVNKCVCICSENQFWHMIFNCGKQKLLNLIFCKMNNYKIHEEIIWVEWIQNPGNLK